MKNQELKGASSSKVIRIAQLFLLLIALWFFFWAHIYDMLFWNKSFVETVTSSIPNIVIYSSLLLTIIALEIYSRSHRQIMTGSKKVRSNDLKIETNQVKKNLSQSKQAPSGTIGATFLVLGIVLTAYSVLADVSTIAFVGLGLTFWGVVFFFARPTKLIQKNVLDASVFSSYANFDRIIENYNYTTKPICIPPYPKDSYLPEHLAGLKEMVLFVAAEDGQKMPAIEELAKKQLTVSNPKGFCITPPGLGILNLFEQELNGEFSKIPKENLSGTLYSLIVSTFELATDFNMEFEGESVHIKLSESVYNELYSSNQKLRSLYSLGCPLSSAIMCALAKVTGKPVTIVESKISLDSLTINVWYKLMEG